MAPEPCIDPAGLRLRRRVLAGPRAELRVLESAPWRQGGIREGRIAVRHELHDALPRSPKVISL